MHADPLPGLRRIINRAHARHREAADLGDVAGSTAARTAAAAESKPTPFPVLIPITEPLPLETGSRPFPRTNDIGWESEPCMTEDGAWDDDAPLAGDPVPPNGNGVDGQLPRTDDVDQGEALKSNRCIAERPSEFGPLAADFVPAGAKSMPLYTADPEREAKLAKVRDDAAMRAQKAAHGVKPLNGTRAAAVYRDFLLILWGTARLNDVDWFLNARGKRVKLEPGEVRITVLGISAEHKLHRSRIKTMLDRLEAAGAIKLSKRSSRHNGVIIQLCTVILSSDVQHAKCRKYELSH